MTANTLTPEYLRSLEWYTRARRVREKALERREHYAWVDRYIEWVARRDSGKLPVGLSHSGRVFMLRGADGCTYDCTNNPNMGTHGYPLGTAIYERIADAMILVK